LGTASGFGAPRLSAAAPKILLLLERPRDAPGREERSGARKDLRLITAVSALICVANDMEPCAVRSPAEAQQLGARKCEEPGGLPGILYSAWVLPCSVRFPSRFPHWT
jgi:hypothetical protein